MHKARRPSTILLGNLKVCHQHCFTGKTSQLSHALDAAHCLLPQLWVRQVIDWSITRWNLFYEAQLLFKAKCVNLCAHFLPALCAQKKSKVRLRCYICLRLCLRERKEKKTPLVVITQPAWLREGGGYLGARTRQPHTAQTKKRN